MKKMILTGIVVTLIAAPVWTAEKSVPNRCQEKQS